MNYDFTNLKCQTKKINQYINSLVTANRKKVRKALNFASLKHRGQVHVNNLPYIIHPIRTALILIEEIKTRNTDLICAALLHDVLEDCSVTLKELKKIFGDKITKLVLSVTRARDKDEKEEDKAINKIIKIKQIAQADKNIRLVKLCDILDNNRSEKFIQRNNSLFKKIPRWHREFKLYLPIAKRTNQKIYQLFKEIQKNFR
jgi:GTP diphosphokinase / guanosine-3',5'-bis(diphosphate) 3'-diphosphatase